MNSACEDEIEDGVGVGIILLYQSGCKAPPESKPSWPRVEGDSQQRGSEADPGKAMLVRKG